MIIFLISLTITFYFFIFLAPRSWLGGKGLGLGGVLPQRFKNRNLFGANNSLKPSDQEKTIELTVMHLWEIH